MPQTSISDDPARGYAGMRADSGRKDAVSRVAEGPVGAGQPLLRGSTSEQAAAIADGDTLDATTFLGFGMLSTTRPFDSTDPIPDEDTLSVMRQGRMLVLLTGDATEGQPVLCGTTEATLGNISSTAATGMVAAPGCRFEESGTAGDLVVIQIVRS